MIEITFVQSDGVAQTVEAEEDLSVMEAATRNSIPGIVADCGGAMSCATCHVYIDDAWVRAVGQADDVESAMLEMAVDPRENSRLSCQVKLDQQMSGLVIHVPKSQF